MKLMSRVGQVMELDPNLDESKAKDFLEKVDSELGDERSSDIKVLSEMMGEEDADNKEGGSGSESGSGRESTED